MTTFNQCSHGGCEEFEDTDEYWVGMYDPDDNSRFAYRTRLCPEHAEDTRLDELVIEVRTA